MPPVKDLSPINLKQKQKKPKKKSKYKKAGDSHFDNCQQKCNYCLKSKFETYNKNINN